MKFALSRTSDWGIPVTVPDKWKPRVTEERTTVERHPATLERNPGLAPTYERVTWSIEINTLEELMEFSEACGAPLVFNQCDIEIYDGYRE